MDADLIHDKAYFEGMRAGWNFAEREDAEGFNASLKARRDEIRDHQKSEASK